MDQVLHMRGVSFHVHWTLADVDAPHHAEWEGRGPAHSHARIRYELSGDGDGADQVRIHQRVQVPGGRLGNVASRVIVGAASEREAQEFTGASEGTARTRLSLTHAVQSTCMRCRALTVSL